MKENEVSLKPRIEILEQPASKAIRFRYECEGRSAVIVGEHSTPENHTYPKVRVVGYDGNEDIVIVASCVTKEQPYRAHPHNLVGKDCKEGVCSINLDKESRTAIFSNLGIQCVKKKYIRANLEQRESKQIDPYKCGFEHKNNLNSIDLSCIRLCFQAILKTSKPGKPTLLARVVSNPMYDKRSMLDLSIAKLSHSFGPVEGGTEMILLCEKVHKDDIQVRFYEGIRGHEMWEAFAEKLSVHKQVAIIFKTPAYHSQEINDKVLVFVQLYRPSDEATSEPTSFHYIRSDLPSPRYNMHSPNPSLVMPVQSDQSQASNGESRRSPTFEEIWQQLTTSSPLPYQNPIGLPSVMPVYSEQAQTVFTTLSGAKSSSAELNGPWQQPINQANTKAFAKEMSHYTNPSSMTCEPLNTCRNDEMPFTFEMASIE